jgi:hypothetical protein
MTVLAAMGIGEARRIGEAAGRAVHDLRDKRGVQEWAFEAKAGEVKDINFAWRIRWPKDKSVVMTPSG